MRGEIGAGQLFGKFWKFESYIFPILLLLLGGLVLLSTGLDAKLSDNIVSVQLLLALSGDTRSLDDGLLNEGKSELLLDNRLNRDRGSLGVGLGVLVNLTGSNGGLDLLAELGGLGSLGLSPVLGQEDDLGAVKLQALNVGVERSLRTVATAVVDGDTIGAGVGGGHTSLLELIQGESTTKTGTTIVHLGRALHDGAQSTSNRAGEDRGGLGLAGGGTTGSTGRLVEPGLDALIPILAQVNVRDNVVVSHHFFS